MLCIFPAGASISLDYSLKTLARDEKFWALRPVHPFEDRFLQQK